MAERLYVGARYVPIFAGEHNPNKQYEALTNVSDSDGHWYTSTRPVPPGVELTDNTYWAYYPDGPKGEAATIDGVTAETLPAGSAATVENIGDETHATFEFGIPQGVQGVAGQITSVSAVTLSPGSDATVQNTGTAEQAVLVFGIPQGAQGVQGIQGPEGPTYTITQDDYDAIAQIVYTDYMTNLDEEEF